MDAVQIELVIELTIVLLAPPLYQFYLWRKGKTTPAQLRKTVKVFAPLYLLVLAAMALVFSR
ncbi:MAG: hypothetical protein EBR89_11765 [Betaproteobacteria bacterium]|nr:hypothetical protein [Betaproteobacteria bacterium]